jgi:hypothetical protein
VQEPTEVSHINLQRKRPTPISTDHVFETESRKKIKAVKSPISIALAPASPSVDINSVQLPLEGVAMTTGGLLRFVLPSS